MKNLGLKTIVIGVATLIAETMVILTVLNKGSFMTFGSSDIIQILDKVMWVFVITSGAIVGAKGTTDIIADKMKGYNINNKEGEEK